MTKAVGLIAALIASAASAQLAATAFDLNRSAPLTLGAWQYIAQPGGSEARFGTRFQLRCDLGARRVLVRRIEPVATIASGPLAISTDTMSRAVASDGWLAATDPLLAAIAFTRGRFVVDGGGGGRLVLPSSPEAARSIEDCRN